MGLFGKKKDNPAPPPAAPPAAPGGIDVAAMQRQAEEMRQQAMHGNLAGMAKNAFAMQGDAIKQMQAAQQGMAASDGGNDPGALLKALGIDWSSDYVIQSTCTTCGGPKKLPSPSAYVYCDYCGSLCDYDFRQAMHTSLTMQTRAEYAQAVNGAQPEIKAALAAGDRERYRELKKGVWEAYATYMPQAISHRIKDASYRAQYVQYMADADVARDFDPGYAALMEEMKQKVTALQWDSSMKTGGPAFQAMVDVCQRQAAAAGRVVEEAGVTDPDRTSEDVRDRMAHALFAQGWLPRLQEADAAWLVQTLGLKGEYIKYEPAADATSQECTGCGGPITVMPGAKSIVCDHCGRKIDLVGLN